MNFESLSTKDLSYLTDSQSRNSYADGLALIDDLLCGFDPERQPPSFLTASDLSQGRMPGDEDLIVSEVERCWSQIRSESLANNIHVNLTTARGLRRLVDSNYLGALDQIRVFLSALLAQYAVVIHPVFSSRD